MTTPIRYFSLDEAREEIRRRRADGALRQAVEEWLGERMLPEFRDRPRAVLFRQLTSPDNGFVFFHQCANYLGLRPFLLEYHEDQWARKNTEKEALIRPMMREVSGECRMAGIASRKAAHGKSIAEVRTWDGRSLPEFHRELMRLAGYGEVEWCDHSRWYRGIGKPREYYHYVYVHAMTHGVWFETFAEPEESESESCFVEQVVLPARDEIRARFRLDPLIVRLYPEDQSDEEDLHWWLYPEPVNSHLLNLAKQHRLPTFPYVRKG